MITAETLGLSEMRAAFAALPGKLQNNVLRGAVRASSMPVRDAAIANVPTLRKPDARRVAGALKKSIRVRGVKVRGTELIGGITAGGGNVRVGKGKKAVIADPFYARFVEFGHLIRARGQRLRGGANARRYQRAALQKSTAPRVAGVHFMRNAGRKAAGSATKAFADYVRQRLESNAKL
jgi:HK97 gp10 family phage protein